MKMMKSLGGRLLSLFAPEVTAGACVPGAGRCCPYRNRRYGCYGNCYYSVSC